MMHGICKLSCGVFLHFTLNKVLSVKKKFQLTEYTDIALSDLVLSIYSFNMGTRPNVLWMGDLEPYMDVNFVRDAYETLGHSVVDVRLINNKHTGMPAAYCFVEFKDSEAAQKALFSLNGKLVPNSGGTVRFKLNHASYGREHLTMKDYSIFVGSLSDDVDDYAFFNTFMKKYSTVHSAKVVLDPQGKSRGYGFVRFKTEEVRDKALKEMQRYKGLGKNLLHVSLAQAKSRTPYNPAQGQQQQASATASQWAGGWNQGGPSYYYDPYYGWQQYSAGYSYDPSQYYDYSQYDQSAAAAPAADGTTPPASTNPAQTPSNMTTVPTTNTPPTSNTPTATTATEADELEDPGLTVDVDRMNAEFMERSEELYQALEGSRWHPLDSVYSTISVQQ